MGGWIERYIEFSKNNEADPAYHYWVGMAVLGAVLKRNVVYTRGYWRVYPSLWILLVGESGSGKSTAIDIGISMLTRIDSVRILAERSSAEALVRELATDSENGVSGAQGVIEAPELAAFMDKREHNQGLVPLLLSLADFRDRWTYNTIKGGRITLTDIAITFIGGSTAELINDCIPPMAIKTGFLARFLVLRGDPEHHDIVPMPTIDAKLEMEVSNELYEISMLGGEMVMPKDALDWWISWYIQHKTKMVSEGSERIKAYLQRKPTYLLRLAMLIGISTNKMLKFTVKAMEEGARRLDHVERSLEQVYNEIEATALGKEQLKILALIAARKDGLPHSELLGKVAYTLSDPMNFKKLMTLLIESRRVILAKTVRGELVYKRGRLD